MDKSEVLTLVSVKHEKDAIGQPVPKETEREVFCNVSSVSRAEWMDAGQMGLKPEYKVTMFVHDYNGEEIAKLNETRFAVYRTYLAADEQIELYLGRRAGV